MEEIHTYSHPRPVVAATVALFHFERGDWATFLGLRNPNSSAYPGFWCLAGGKLEAKAPLIAGETVEETAIREVYEEAGISLRHEQLRFLLVSSDPKTDPRGHFVNIFYMAIVDVAQRVATKVGSDLCDGGWFSYRETYGKSFAFDHKTLNDHAQRKLRGWE